MNILFVGSIAMALNTLGFAQSPPKISTWSTSGPILESDVKDPTQDFQISYFGMKTALSALQADNQELPNDESARSKKAAALTYVFSPNYRSKEARLDRIGREATALEKWTGYVKEHLQSSKTDGELKSSSVEPRATSATRENAKKLLVDANTLLKKVGKSEVVVPD